MIHIVFQEADIDVLQKAIELDTNLAGEVIQIKDDYSTGPVADIYETEGYQQRRDWWKQALQHSPYADATDLVDDKLTVHNLLRQLDDDKTLQVWIWMGQNAHDVCGYYWLMSQLKEYQGQINVLYLNNLPFINEKGGLFYPSNLYEIQPKEFLKAKRLSRPITLSEFEVDPDEWKKIYQENALVRILEGGKKIVSKPDNFFDKDIVSLITAEPQKLPKLLHALYSKVKIKTGDVFVVWRLQKLAETGQIEINGDLERGWKELTVRLAGESGLTNENE